MPEKLSTKASGDWLQMIKPMVEDIKYGTISIVVQDGKVVQLEQNKKIRL